jgi:hypothetical protein
MTMLQFRNTKNGSFLLMLVIVVLSGCQTHKTDAFVSSLLNPENETDKAAVVKAAAVPSRSDGLQKLPTGYFFFPGYPQGRANNFNTFLGRYRPNEVWGRTEKTAGCHPGRTEIKWSNAVLKGTLIPRVEYLKVKGRSKKIGCIFLDAVINYKNGSVLKSSALSVHSLSSYINLGNSSESKKSPYYKSMLYYKDASGRHFYVMGGPRGDGQTYVRSFGVYNKSTHTGVLKSAFFRDGNSSWRSKSFYGQVTTGNGHYFIGPLNYRGIPNGDGFCASQSDGEDCRFNKKGEKIPHTINTAKSLYPGDKALETLPSGISQAAKMDFLRSRLISYLKKENWKYFLTYKHAIEDQGYDLGREVEFYVAKALYNSGHGEIAEQVLMRYVNKTGSNGHYYSDALSVLPSYQKWATNSRNKKQKAIKSRFETRKDFCQQAVKLIGATPEGCIEFRSQS